MMTRKLLAILLACALLLLLPACDSPKRSPLQDWDDLFNRLLSEDGQSFQAEVPWYSSEADILQSGGWTTEDVTYLLQTEEATDFFVKEQLPFEKMELSCQVGYLLWWDQLRYGSYGVSGMTQENNAAFCAALEKWAAKLSYSPSSPQTAADFLAYASQYDNAAGQNMSTISWTDKNGYTLSVSWQYAEEPDAGSLVKIEVSIAPDIFYSAIGAEPPSSRTTFS